MRRTKSGAGKTESRPEPPEHVHFKDDDSTTTQWMRSGRREETEPEPEKKKKRRSWFGSAARDPPLPNLGGPGDKLNAEFPLPLSRGSRARSPGDGDERK